MDQGNLKKDILLKSHIKFFKKDPLFFFFNDTEQEVFPLPTNMKTQEKILVASNSNRGNGDNFTAENEMGKPSRKPLVCHGIKNLHPE